MKKRSYGMLIASMLIFGTVGIFRRAIPLSSGFIAFVRGCLGGVCLLLFSCRKETEPVPVSPGSKKNILLLLVTGGIIGFNWILLFEAYNYTSVATATLCYYMQPTLLILLAPLFLKEKLTGRRFLCALISGIGMVFVSGILDTEETGNSDIKGVAFGLSAALLYTFAVILNKKIPARNLVKKTMIELFSAAAVLVPYLLLTMDFQALKIELTPLLLLLVMGIVHTGIAYALYFGSLEHLSSQTVAILSYIDPVTALLLSVFLLHEKLSLFAIIGGILILGATLLSEVLPQKSSVQTD